jgi:hypothetical protein
VPKELKGKTLTVKPSYKAGPFEVKLEETTFTVK